MSTHAIPLNRRVQGFGHAAHPTVHAACAFSTTEEQRPSQAKKHLMYSPLAKAQPAARPAEQASTAPDAISPQHCSHKLFEHPQPKGCGPGGCGGGGKHLAAAGDHRLRTRSTLCSSGTLGRRCCRRFASTCSGMPSAHLSRADPPPPPPAPRHTHTNSRRPRSRWDRVAAPESPLLWPVGVAAPASTPCRGSSCRIARIRRCGGLCRSVWLPKLFRSSRPRNNSLHLSE